MIVVLSEALQNSKRIETVNMTSSLSSSNGGSLVLRPLAHSIRLHVTLKTLHLSYNQLNDASPLGASLELNQSSLTELHLDHNRLGFDTAVALSRVLRRNNTLSVLQLNSNHLGDEGGTLLAEALQHNTGLKNLGLARNSLRSKTANALLRALTGDGSSNRSNVTLVRLHLSDNPGLPSSLERTISYLVRANRAGRYLLRSSKASVNFSCKGNNEGDACNRSLWPRVLEGLDADIIYFFLREKPSLVAPHKN